MNKRRILNLIAAICLMIVSVIKIFEDKIALALANALFSIPLIWCFIKNCNIFRNTLSRVINILGICFFVPAFLFSVLFSQPLEIIEEGLFLIYSLSLFELSKEDESAT